MITLPDDGEGRSQFVLSMAFDRDNLDAGDIRIGAIGHDGKRMPRIKWSAVSGAGTNNRVVTFVCSFGYGHDEIAKLVIESIVELQ